MYIYSDEIETKEFKNIHVVDVIDYSEQIVMPRVEYWKKFIDKYKNQFIIEDDELVLDNPSESFSVSLELDKKLDKNYIIEDIDVSYGDDYELKDFNEYDCYDTYNLDEFNTLQNCIEEKKDCTYIDHFCYSIFLQIELKQKGE